MTVPNDVALYELAIKAGVYMDNKVFRRIYGLISLGCSPDVIFSMLKYLTSVQSINRNSISNISTTTSRSTEQHHQVNRSRFLASRILESQQSFLSTFSDRDQYFNGRNHELCKTLSNKPRVTQHHLYSKPNL
ncbi:unnamed protein product [Schistosoma margrebowiei]|uniref:Pentatricopeptide repeat-containing protein n=1 Tax=Schistosoma margrebowiei TaxID=48269 RepID=A0AA84ZKB1_9TREM|nr:unnamed protein product [Schistosoma margrebowiei]